MTTIKASWVDPGSAETYDAIVEHNSDWSGIAKLTISKGQFKRVVPIPAQLLRRIAQAIEKRRDGV